MIYFIYVKYSNDQNLNNFLEFKKIIDNISKFSKGVIVENGGNLLEIILSGVDIIKGSNTYYDLSAYDEGFKYLLENNNLNENDLVIFANDTLLLKHKFSKITKAYITWKIKKLINLGFDFAFGDIDKSKKISRYNMWISTYFFVTTLKGIKFFKNFVIEENNYKNMILKVEPPKIKWGNYFNSEFKIEINSWLDPESENNYFKINNRKIDNMFFSIKLHNIIAERVISDILINNQVKIYSLRPNLFFKVIRKIENFKALREIK